MKAFGALHAGLEKANLRLANIAIILDSHTFIRLKTEVDQFTRFDVPESRLPKDIRAITLYGFEITETKK
jgi:hypothetical protein